MASRIVSESLPSESVSVVTREMPPLVPDVAVVNRRSAPEPLEMAEKLAALRTELSGARTRLLQERISHSVQRAAAEQAHRVGEAATTFVGLLLENLAQPAFQVSPEGEILRWNGAISTLTGIGTKVALGRHFGEVLTLEQAHYLTREIARYLSEETDLPRAGELPGESPLGYTLIPQFRIAHCLETVVVLLHP